MSGDVAYVDTSAFVKTVLQEPESAALAHYSRGWGRFASSALLRVELLRTVRRFGPERLALARARLAAVSVIAMDDAILEAAGLLDPPTMRSLDAIHLASAQVLGSDLGVFITYDQRLASAASSLGFAVASPQ